MENIINYKTILYTVFIMISAIGVSSLNFKGMFKKDKIIESRILVVLLSIVLGYFITNFVIDFLELSSIL